MGHDSRDSLDFTYCTYRRRIFLVEYSWILPCKRKEAKMGGCYSKNKYTMGDEAPTKKGKKKTEEEIKAENNGNLNASPNKLLDDKSIPFIDRCSGTLGDRSSIMEEDEKQEGNEAKADDK